MNPTLAAHDRALLLAARSPDFGSSDGDTGATDTGAADPGAAGSAGSLAPFTFSSGDKADHDELFALEAWIKNNHEEAVKRHQRSSEAAAELTARLICVLEVMHTVLGEPGDLQASVEQWRQRRERILERIGSSAL